MDLHRSRSKPEWELIDPGHKMNRHQKLAAKSSGLITVANAVSLSGFLAVDMGIRKLKKQRQKSAFILFTLAGLCDISDGFISQKLGTIGPVGEAVDALTDKFKMLRTLTGLIDANILSKRVAYTFLAQNAGSAALALFAKTKGLEHHPSKLGKFNMAAQSTTIVFSTVKASHNKPPNIFNTVEPLVEISTMVLGAVALIDYGKKIFNYHNQQDEPVNASRILLAEPVALHD